MFILKSSLKTRILFSTGSVLVTLMLLISVVILLQWRDIIISKETENAYAVSRTFTVTIVDALIFEQNSVFQKEKILETYINDFINHLENVKYVTVYDQNAIPIASHSVSGTGINTPHDDKFDEGKEQAGVVSIFNHPESGWTIQCTLPMLLSGKNWGSIKIGFDAQPIRDEISSLFLILLLSTIILTSVVLLILYYSVNHLTYSLEKLVVEMDKIDLFSDRDISLPVQNDEIGFLYHNFGLLKRRLENSKADLEKAQKQVYQAEKLASIGRLASGVAHQVNNPLNGIKSCLYAIKKDPGNVVQTKEYSELINEGIENIETVVKKLLGFARQQSKSETTINVNESIDKVVTLFDYRLKDNKLQIKLNYGKDLPPVKIDYHLFQEVIMNLLLNSFDAIEKEGTITISTSGVTGGRILIEVSDNGSGIDPETLKKIFDPFFTTKEIGIGTGLGLSVCLGIIESHNGKIEVESAPGKGTTFKVYLPVEN